MLETDREQQNLNQEEEKSLMENAKCMKYVPADQLIQSNKSISFYMDRECLLTV